MNVYIWRQTTVNSELASQPGSNLERLQIESCIRIETLKRFIIIGQKIKQRFNISQRFSRDLTIAYQSVSTDLSFFDLLQPEPTFPSTICYLIIYIIWNFLVRTAEVSCIPRRNGEVEAGTGGRDGQVFGKLKEAGDGRKNDRLPPPNFSGNIVKEIVTNTEIGRFLN